MNCLQTTVFFTDDTIMTIAVAKAIAEIQNNSNLEIVDTDNEKDRRELRKLTIRYMQQLGRLYPNADWGSNFGSWIKTANPKPYNSFGNGAAMRVSACGFMAINLKNALGMCDIVTGVSHNHPEGIRGARATTAAIYLAWAYNSKGMIKKYVEEHFKYDLDFTLDGIRNTYMFNETCQETVPQAIVAFLESNSFEDAIRNAISIGGDSDTLAAITGSIAEAYYGVPKDIQKKAESYLDNTLYKEYKHIGWYQ